jgi:hypothetical protein
MNPDKNLAAVCGLFCPSCGSYIGTKEDPERLEAIAQRFGRPVSDVECHGCRTDKRSFFCRTECKMARCAAEKGIDFCGECPDYPCDDLKDFQSKMPHRLELWQNHERIKEVGYEKWFEEMTGHYACSECGTLNTAYELKGCRKCGHAPANDYIREHMDEIIKKLSK